MKLHELKCPACNADLKISKNKERTFCFCEYCGCKILLDNEKQEITINKNVNITKTTSYEERHIDDAKIVRAYLEDKKDKRENCFMIFLFVFLLLISLSCALIPNIYQSIKRNEAISQGFVSVGYYADLIDQDYHTVVAHFESAGFDNIETIDLNDSGIMFWKEGKVEIISIAGDTSFSMDDYFPTDAKVVISYH